MRGLFCMRYENERKQFSEAVSKYADKDNFLIGCGNICEPKFDITQYKGDRNKKYAVKIFLDKKYFAVWNLTRHLQYGGKSTCCIADSWDEIEFENMPFVDIYKSLGKRNSGILEKILLVKFEYFKEFFLNYKVYMSFNEFDLNFPYGNTITNEATNIYDESIRKRYSTTKAYRDAKFRDDVLEAYNYKCAICRCDIQEILQAAHERGYEVANTESDDSQHGICLCANHHLMYDNKLIDIDTVNHMLKINDNRLYNSLWFKEFSNKYNLKIAERKN